jgi:hypothetical protein
MAEGRRPVEGKVSSNACSGRSAGLSMSQKQRACGSWRPNPRSRLTFDESPLRESCTVGSMGEVPGNWHLYPTTVQQLQGVRRRDRSQEPGNLVLETSRHDPVRRPYRRCTQQWILPEIQALAEQEPSRSGNHQLSRRPGIQGIDLSSAWTDWMARQAHSCLQSLRISSWSPV